jgi:hypothetical protein
MIESGKGMLYLTLEYEDGTERTAYGRTMKRIKSSGGKLTNWPGTLELKVRYATRGAHNIAGTRYDVWFTGPDGKEWHGVQLGENSQICRVHRLKNQ